MFRILWDPSSGSIRRASLKLLVMFCVHSRCLAAWNLDLCVCVCATSSSQFVARHTHTHHRPKFHAAKHRLRTQNITSNFSEARLILHEDGSQKIRNMSEIIIAF